MLLTSTTHPALAFVVSETLGAGARPVDVVTADFDRDGRPDVATASYGSDAAYVVMNQGGGTYVTPRAYDAGPVPVSIATTDFDSDGKRAYRVGWYTWHAATGDFDGDGVEDVASTSDKPDSSIRTVRFGDGRGGLRPDVFTKGWREDARSQITAADVNGDGKLDVACPEVAQVALGDGHGGFGAPLYLPPPLHRRLRGDEHPVHGPRRRRQDRFRAVQAGYAQSDPQRR